MARTTSALARVRQFIDQKQFPPQSQLPPERDLAIELGLTRSQLRTVMRKLVEEGLVWRHVGKGTFMGGQTAVDAVAAADSLQPNRVRSINPRELVDARLALEPRMARLAAVSASETDLARMDLCIANCRRSKNWEDFAKWDASLHMTIAEACRNTLLLELYRSITAPEHGWVWGRLKRRSLTSERQAEATLEHARLVDAIRSGDMNHAERLMRHHLEGTQSRLTASTYQSPG